MLDLKPPQSYRETYKSWFQENAEALTSDSYSGTRWFISANVGPVHEETVIIATLGFNANLKPLFAETKIVGPFLKISTETNNSTH